METGIATLPAAAMQEQTKEVDPEVNNYIFQATHRSIIETTLKKDSVKEIWESMRVKCQGSIKVKRGLLQALRKEFEILGMKEDESVDDYFREP